MAKYKNILLYLLCIIISFVYALILLKPQVADIYHIEKDMKEKTAEISDLQKKLENLKAAALQQETTSPQTKNIYNPDDPGLDAESSFTVPFNDIVEMAKYNGVKIYSIEYVYNPTDDEFVKGAGNTYNVCQLKMQVIADYQDLESFLRELYKYPYLVNIEKIELTPYIRNKKMIISNLQIKLYSSKGSSGGPSATAPAPAPAGKAPAQPAQPAASAPANGASPTATAPGAPQTTPPPTN